MFVKLREPVNGLMHLGAAIAAGIGLVALLVIGRDSLPKQASLLIYGAALILMFSASAAYHLIPAQPQTAVVLRKLDHSAIYLLIAGTYTPICIHFFSGFWRWGVLAIIWSMAIVGVAVKVFSIGKHRWRPAPTGKRRSSRFLPESFPSNNLLATSISVQRAKVSCRTPASLASAGAVSDDLR